MENATVISAVVEALVPVLLALLSWASFQLTMWLRGHVKHQNARMALEKLNEVTETVVTDLMQTTASRLKSLSADGKLTPAEARMLREEAASRVMALLVGEAQSAAKKFCKDYGVDHAQLEHLVGSKIEAAVIDRKSWFAPVKKVGS